MGARGVGSVARLSQGCARGSSRGTELSGLGKSACRNCVAISSPVQRERRKGPKELRKRPRSWGNCGGDQERSGGTNRISRLPLSAVVIESSTWQGSFPDKQREAVRSSDSHKQRMVSLLRLCLLWRSCVGQAGIVTMRGKQPSMDVRRPTSRTSKPASRTIRPEAFLPFSPVDRIEERFLSC